ncbi:G-3-P permease [Cedecea neteri]|uniref:G-3-P permease n=1 Tax=Cedecea neteri TaxID=158822 RepID=A0A2X3J557_9ENTR|nr:G-3-P permease [Cedecea neteri]
MFVLLFACGWFQGMGWPPCGRTMVHWWSQKERWGHCFRLELRP